MHIIRSRQLFLRALSFNNSKKFTTFKYPEVASSQQIIEVRNMSHLNIGDMRKPYMEAKQCFTEDSLVSDEPFGQFKVWFEEACKTDSIREANAMCIATATKDGFPSARMVLLKGYSEEGFTFYTSLNSRKGKELSENSRASLCFYWEPVIRSVRIEGDVKMIEDEKTAEYFASRPRESQIGATAACNLPKVIPNRDVMANYIKKAEKEYEGKDIPKPESWVGYVVIPHTFEFWQGQSDRMHDRIIFRRKRDGEVIDLSVTKEGKGGWLIERLSPY